MTEMLNELSIDSAVSNVINFVGHDKNVVKHCRLNKIESECGATFFCLALSHFGLWDFAIDFAGKEKNGRRRNSIVRRHRCP